MARKQVHLGRLALSIVGSMRDDDEWFEMQFPALFQLAQEALSSAPPRKVIEELRQAIDTLLREGLAFVEIERRGPFVYESRRLEPEEARAFVKSHNEWKSARGNSYFQVCEAPTLGLTELGWKLAST